MDYHQFKTYEKITNAAAYPRTRQEQGLFLLELGFSPEEETRSINVSMTAEFSGFGDVVRLQIDHMSACVSPQVVSALKSQLAATNPLIVADYQTLEDRLTLQFMENPAHQTRKLSGALVLNTRNEICTVLVRLR